jgi:hypothetical protein
MKHALKYLAFQYSPLRGIFGGTVLSVEPRPPAAIVLDTKSLQIALDNKNTRTVYNLHIAKSPSGQQFLPDSLFSTSNRSINSVSER